MEAQHDPRGITQMQLRQNIVADLARGAGREGRDGNVGEALAQRAELAILRPELVTPFRDAVRLIDGEKADGDARQPFEHILAHDAFGGDVE